MKLSYIVDLVCTYYPIYVVLFSPGIDDDGFGGSNEGSAVAYRFTVFADEKPVAASEQCSVSIKCLYGKERLYRFLCPTAWLGHYHATEEHGNNYVYQSFHFYFIFLFPECPGNLEFLGISGSSGSSGSSGFSGFSGYSGYSGLSRLSGKLRPIIYILAALWRYLWPLRICRCR